MSNNSNYIEKVEEFMTTFKQPVIETPSYMPEYRNKLRIALIFEELKEYAEASGLLDYFSELCIHSSADFAKNVDETYVPITSLVEQLDALCDLQYVLSGAVIENGFKDIFDEAFNEVHRSNMSKACNSQQEALMTLAHYKKKDNTEGYYKEVNGKWLVYRSSDDKVLKSINYSPANIKGILDA